MVVHKLQMSLAPEANVIYSRYSINASIEDPPPSHLSPKDQRFPRQKIKLEIEEGTPK